MNRGIAHLVAGTVLSFVIFILPPVSVHAPNAAEFTEPALLLLLPFIGLFLVGALLAGLISRLTSYPPALLVIYLCCSAASLIVTQIFSSSAGIVIDGGFHEYELSYLRASGEILAVVATFGLGFLFRRRIGENGGFIAAAISLWVLPSAGMAAAHYLPGRPIRRGPRRRIGAF
jgi:hypothetical protein